MKVFIQSPCVSGDTNGALDHLLLRGFDRVDSQEECDVIAIPITTVADFEFNEKLNDIKKPYVLLDYTELEWNYFDNGEPTMLFGQNAKDCRWLKENWHPFSDFVRDHPPAVYFKRELLAKDVTDKVKPIDWPCVLEIPKIQTEAEFNARRYEVLFVWGYSHPSRPRLHADIFRGMANYGIDVVSTIEQYFKRPVSNGARAWASIYSPYYDRAPMSIIAMMQQDAKIGVSLPGAGRKCFRSAEAPVGSIMAAPSLDGLAWSYPWEHSENFIGLWNCSEDNFDWLNKYVRELSLYPIYLAGQETIRKYQTKTYIENYINPLIAANI